MKNPAFIAIGRFFFYWRDYVFVPLIVVLFWAFEPARSAFGSAGGETLLDVLGLLAVVAGILLRIAMMSASPVKRDGQAKQVHANALRTDGLFELCRNPLYVGNVLIALGYFLIHGALPVIVIGMAITLFVYFAIIANEEDFLRATFGAEYEAFVAGSNRWLPRIGRLGAVLRSVEFDWRGSVRAEKTVVTFATLISAGAFWYEAGTRTPPAISWGIFVAGAAFVAVALVIRAQKQRVS